MLVDACTAMTVGMNEMRACERSRREPQAPLQFEIGNSRSFGIVEVQCVLQLPGLYNSMG